MESNSKDPIERAINKVKYYGKKMLQLYKVELSINDKLTKELKDKTTEVWIYKQHKQILYSVGRFGD